MYALSLSLSPSLRRQLRMPGDMEKVSRLRSMVDCFEAPPPDVDAHVIATLLKLWYRELAEPLVPTQFYR